MLPIIQLELILIQIANKITAMKIIVGIIGGLCWISACVIYYSKSKNQSQITKGKIVSLRESKFTNEAGESLTVYYPTVSFMVQNETFEAETKPNNFRIGQEVDVKFDQYSSHKLEILQPKNQIRLVLGLVILGILLFVLSLI